MTDSTAARSARPASAAATGRPPRAGDVLPLPDEPALWAAAPLSSDGRRELRAWSDATRTRLVTHYLPLALRLLHRHAVTLAYDLPADEVESQAAEWLVEALRRYNPACGPSFAAYLATMLPKWVHDVARRNSGRYVNDSKIAIARARDRCLVEHQHEPTPAELTDALGGNPDHAARRRRAVALSQGLRRPVDLESVDTASVAVRADGGLWVYGAPDDADQPDAELLARDSQRSATYALAHSAWNGDGLDTGDNTAGLVAFVLTEIEGYAKQDVAAAAQCHTRRLTAAVAALRAGARARLAAD